MALAAKEAALTKRPSAHVTIDNHGQGLGPSRIEVYAPFEAHWRGEQVVGTMIGDRYRHSSGWSEWRIVVSHTRPDVSGTARAAIRDAVAPIVAAWCESDEYQPAYQRAHAAAIARHLRDERYSTDTARRLVDAAPLNPTDARRLARAIVLTDELIEVLAAIGSEEA